MSSSSSQDSESPSGRTTAVRASRKRKEVANAPADSGNLDLPTPAEIKAHSQALGLTDAGTFSSKFPARRLTADDGLASGIRNFLKSKGLGHEEKSAGSSFQAFRVQRYFGGARDKTTVGFVRYAAFLDINFMSHSLFTYMCHIFCLGW